MAAPRFMQMKFYQHGTSPYVPQGTHIATVGKCMEHFWHLEFDFFHSLYPLMCLRPHTPSMIGLQASFLEYSISLYPLAAMYW